MTVTAKLYPSFLEEVLSTDSYNFSIDGEIYSISCNVALYNKGLGNSYISTDPVSINYSVNDTKTSDLQYHTTPASFLAGVTPEGSTWSSYKPTKLYFQKTGADIAFWLDEITWDDIPDGEKFDRIFVSRNIAISSGGSGADIIESRLIMYIGLPSQHTVDGPFKLRKATGGEIKITFS
jgi:hypothetical protein